MIISTRDRTEFAAEAAWRAAVAASRALSTPAAAFPADPLEFGFLRRPARFADVVVRSAFERLGPWSYPVETENLSARPFADRDDEALAAQRRRKSLICEAILRLHDGRLEGRSVLDAACGGGLVLLELAHLGAGRCVGLDADAESVARANFLRSLYGLDRADCRVGRAEDLHEPPFDVVVSLSLPAGPAAASPLKALRRLTKDVCVIDAAPRPSYRALLDAVFDAGFADVVEAIGVSEGPVPGGEARARRCLLAFRRAQERARLERICGPLYRDGAQPRAASKRANSSSTRRS